MSSRSEKQAEILSGLSEFRATEAVDVPSVKCDQIVSALDQFMECVRYLNTRRSKGTKLNLESEADVQDALYLMLRPWVLDLVYENPTDKVGNRFAIKDYISKEAKTVIEAKYVRDAAHGKSIAKELHDDIETYRHHPSCDHLVFFVYDPDSLIPNVAALQTEMTTKRVYDGKLLVCHLIVCP